MIKTVRSIFDPKNNTQEEERAAFAPTNNKFTQEEIMDLERELVASPSLENDRQQKGQNGDKADTKGME